MRAKGMTILEIIVAMLILVLVIAGLANLFVAGKRFVLSSRSRMAGGELGKYFLDPLQLNVTQSNWDQAGNNLMIGPDRTGSAVRLEGNIEYTPTYNITDVTGTDLRRVKLILSWQEKLAKS
jgi:Tfp pilus assembly protein PilV